MKCLLMLSIECAQDVVGVVNHRPFYQAEIDSFDRMHIGYGRLRMAAEDYEALTGIPTKILLTLNYLNIFPVHDLPFYLGGMYD